MRDEAPSFAVLGYTACALTCALFIKSIYLQYPIIPDEALYALQAKFLQDTHFDTGLPNVLFFTYTIWLRGSAGITWFSRNFLTLHFSACPYSLCTRQHVASYQLRAHICSASQYFYLQSVPTQFI